MDNYPVVSFIEENINNEVNSLIGNNDTNLKTIIKMAKLKDINPDVKKEEFENIITQIHNNNKLMALLIEKEYELTYDHDGNIIPVNNINEGKKVEKNS